MANSFGIPELGKLPNELLFKIAREVAADDDVDADLAAFARTCRRLHAAGDHLLYSRAKIRHPYLLAYAAECGNIHTIKRLLQEGVDVNTRHCRVVQHFKCPFEKQRNRRCAPRAATFKDNYLVREDKITSSAEYVAGGYTNIWEFCKDEEEQGHSQVLGFAREGTPLWARRDYEASPLHLAAGKGHLAVMNLLLDNGASIDAEDSRACTCSRYPATAERLTGPTLASLLPLGGGHTPLHMAACQGRAEAVELLMTKGAKIFDVNHSYLNDLFYYAVTLQQPEIAKQCLLDTPQAARQELVNRRDHRGLPPIWYAAQDYHYGSAMLSLLAENGADLDADLGVGFTPLIHACLLGRFDVASKLLHLGASPHMRYEWCNIPIITDYEHHTGQSVTGFRPLDLVATFQHSRDSTSREGLDSWGRAEYKCLTAAARAVKQVELVGELLDKGARIDYVAVGYGMVQSAVLLAAQRHNMAVLEAIIKHPRFRSKEGCSQAIMMAMRNGACDNFRIFNRPARPTQIRTGVGLDPHFQQVEAWLREASNWDPLEDHFEHMGQVLSFALEEAAAEEPAADDEQETKDA
ncbi:ankyrin repeat-containing domain protein [Lasiosphaeris hirsuta]|uniref:Ankyrin repeat-containing domain protein n=1 Tax=Lasiosphaeris hirsuta TaxID=260670 RepID=A0AA40DU90_9PEZI|nr:ankyrin repeat-containing domain protein [Lasiosphaeris hirsuta]